MTSIDYPIRTNDIKKFVQFNSSIAINIYGYEDEVSSPSEYQIFMRDNTVLISVDIK